MDRKRKTLIAALVLGALAGPAVALGASGFLSGGDVAEASAAPAPVAASVVMATEAVAVPETDAESDLLEACTVDGHALTQAEAAGTITDVEQAALDALRDICTEAGLDLAEPVLDEITEQIVIRTVTVSATSTGGGYDDDGEDDDDDEEHEEEEEEEEEHEDDEDEDDEDDDSKDED